MTTEKSSTRAVWKFPLPFPGNDLFTIEMPASAEILSLQMQFNEPQIWALVTPGADMEIRRFRVAGTGHPIDEQAIRFVGTFQFAGGALIFHVFEIQP
jgi:hypothetical protein